MDTKWKKSKLVLSFISYAVSVSLLAAAAMFHPYFAFHSELQDMKVILSAKEGYEQTADFRSYVAELLNNLIRISAGKRLPYSVTEYAGTWDSESVTDFWNLRNRDTVAYEEATVRTEAVLSVVQEAKLAAGAQDAEETAIVIEESLPGTEDSFGVWPTDWGRDNNGEGQSEKEAELMRSRFLEHYYEDKNLLYEVNVLNSGEEPVIYRNAERVDLNADASALLDQYSFVLKFDGEKARAWLEGEELELYGDGIYLRNGKQWAIPGYENYKLPEEWKCGQITIAVRRVPMLYTVDTEVYGSSLYWIHRNLQERQYFFRLWIGLVIGAAAAAVLSVCLRRFRRAAIRKIGNTLGRVPFEPAVSAAAVLLAAGCALYMDCIYWGSNTSWLTLWKIVLLWLWTLWLLYVYLRYGNKPWRNSLVVRCIRFFQKKELKLDIQERIAGRISRPVHCLIIGIGLGIGGYLLRSCDWWKDGEYAMAAEWIAAGMLAAAALALLEAAGLLIYGGYCQWKLATDLGLLSDQIDAAYAGGEHNVCEMPANSDLAKMAGKVAGIRDGFEKAVEERMKSERMKVELVANVSHDIKTPLTSIISYVDLLKEDDSLPEELKDYVAILAQKSERLKEMVQDVFEVSKASSGQLPIQMEKLDLAKLLYQTLADMQEQIDDTPVSLKVRIPKEAVEIYADGQRLYRVFQNLLQNALQYSLEGSRIYVALEKKGSLAIASVRNTSRYELNGEIDFTERFVRGDNSRTDGGSGLGLSIAKSFTEACGGTFKVETIADLFVVTVEFALEETDEEPTLLRE